jgi:hypothetical protein
MPHDVELTSPNVPNRPMTFTIQLVQADADVEVPRATDFDHVDVTG